MRQFEAVRREPMKFLRTVLRANAAFSLLSGILMLAGGARLGAWLGKPGSVATDGLVLLVFAAAILWITRLATINLKAAAAIIALDAIYVIDTTRQLLAGDFSTAGNWFYGIATVVVADFAALQLLGLLEARRSANLRDSEQTATG